MNLFFKTYQDYYTKRSAQSVRNDVEKITKRKLSDYSENIYGTLNADGSFKLSQKWALVQIGGFERMPSYLSGTISREGGRTKISTSLRPNPMFILLFYGSIVFFFCELVGVETFLKGSTSVNLLFFAIFGSLNYWMIKFFPNKLKSRFERLLIL